MKKRPSMPCVCLTSSKRHRFFFSRIQRLTKRVLTLLRQKTELNVVFVSDPEIKRLNRRFHFRNRETDVLAFPEPRRWPAPVSRPAFLGDIAISIKRVFVHAKQFRVPPDEELMRYVTHGILHLLGEKDSTPTEQKRMRKREEAILVKLRPLPRLIRSKPA